MDPILVPKVTNPQARLELIVPEPSVTFDVMEDKKDLLQAFAARMNDVCDALGVPPAGKNRQEVLGKMFGVTQKAARKWLVGEGFPDTAICINIALKANVSYDWLMTGRGSMFMQVTTDKSEADYSRRRILLTPSDGPVGVFGEDLEELRKTLEAALLVINNAAANK